MSAKFEIRESRETELDAVKDIYSAVFPDEELRPLVEALFHEPASVLSVVAYIDGEIVGHVAFTDCEVSDRAERVALLGPLAVAPDRHRQGIGSALIAEGRRLLADAGVASLYVLGDPAYYSRFGFAPERAVQPPYPLPAEWRDAWQSLTLNAPAEPLSGELRVPAVWAVPELWG